MASLTMTSSFLGNGSATVTTSRQLPATARRSGLVAVRASQVEQEVANAKNDNSSRRDLMFAFATVALCSVAKVAMADEPKRGTAEAKKKYAPICVTMPTARICRN